MPIEIVGLLERLNNMRKENNVQNEKDIANVLRNEILKTGENVLQQPEQKISLDNIEYISTQEKPYISPIMTMNQDEILDFVESFGVEELATLSVAELNRIGEVLGVPPEILTEGME